MDIRKPWEVHGRVASASYVGAIRSPIRTETLAASIVTPASIAGRQVRFVTCGTSTCASTVPV